MLRAELFGARNMALPVALLALAACASIRARPSDRTLAGSTSFVRTTSSSGPAGVATPRSGGVEWTARVISAGWRGRMDIVAGAQPPLWEAGNYVLFDTTDHIVVRPSSRTFSVISLAQQPLARVSDSLGISTTFSGVTVSLDSLGPGEAIEGRPSLHYRLNLAFTMTLDFRRAGLPEGSPTTVSTKTEMTTDYWLVRLPGVMSPPGTSNVLMRRSGPVARAADIWTRVSTAMERVPRGMTAVRVETSTRSTNQTVTTVTVSTMEITDVRFGDIDANLLTLPDDFSPAPVAGLGDLSGGTGEAAAARWRARRQPASRR